MIVLILILWWVIGTVGFVYWWTNEWDLTIPDLAIAGIAGGLLGPLAWPFGWMVHHDADSHTFTNPFDRKVLMHKRGSK